ncbi:DUF1707 SHOCT-like domain-containing protein [Nocardia lasii]|uniref:DUF1707 domain-containing protein n=1 Tax=Nocardia lasii TaxID=1616107 RepID=A0ABW1JST2_9NOCA
MADSGRAPRAADSVTRARDIDRAQVSTVLDAAYAEGQLGAQEYHDRVARATSARTLGELSGLTADLQSPAVFGGPAVTHTRRRHFAEYPPRTRAREQDREATRTALDTARADGQLDADEHRALSELATEARTLGDLATLVADLQQRPVAPVKPHSRDLARPAIVVVAVLAAIGGFVWTVRPDTPPPLPVTVAAIDFDAAPPLVIDTPSPATVPGFLRIREDYHVKFGDVLVDELVLHDTHASVKRIAPDNPNRTVDYTYRGGFSRSSTSSMSRGRDQISLDLDQVNTDALGAVLAAAPTTLAVPGGAVSHLRLAMDSRTKQPQITVYVRNEADQSGHLVLTPGGEIVSTYPNKD